MAYAPAAATAPEATWRALEIVRIRARCITANTPIYLIQVFSSHSQICRREALIRASLSGSTMPRGWDAAYMLLIRVVAMCVRRCIHHSCSATRPFSS